MRHSYNKKRIFICPILNLQGCKLTPNDLVGYNNYTDDKTSGEGRLEDSVKKTIQNFKLADISKETIREIKEENKGKMERDEMKKARKDVNRVTKKHISKLKHSKTMRIGAKTDNDIRRSIRKRIYPTGGKKKTVKNKIRFRLW